MSFVRFRAAYNKSLTCVCSRKSSIILQSNHTHTHTTDIKQLSIAKMTHRSADGAEHTHTHTNTHRTDIKQLSIAKMTHRPTDGAERTHTHTHTDRYIYVHVWFHRCRCHMQRLKLIKIETFLLIYFSLCRLIIC